MENSVFNRRRGEKPKAALKASGNAEALDSELAAAAKQGLDSAFQALLERYLPVIRSRANRYAAVVGQDVEDFIQEGMLALVRAVRGFDEASGFLFKTYAVTCINNSMASAIKKHMRNFVAELPLEETGDDARDTMQPEDMFIEQEDSAKLLWQIQSLLSDFEREVLRHYLRGQSYQEIGVALAAAPKAVDNALQRVRRKLRPGFKAGKSFR
jgi:RNA polymerase sporulation-specific sigma factor